MNAAALIESYISEASPADKKKAMGLWMKMDMTKILEDAGRVCGKEMRKALGGDLDAADFAGDKEVLEGAAKMLCDAVVKLPKEYTDALNEALKD